MNLFLQLLAFLFAADVDALGSRSWEVRTSAHARLREAGFWAFPALLEGLRTANVERQWRCEALIDSRTEPVKRYLLVWRFVHREVQGWSDPITAELSNDLVASRLAYQFARSAGVPFCFDLEGYEDVYGGRKLDELTPIERYYLFLDLAHAPKPLHKPTSIPQTMEKP